MSDNSMRLGGKIVPIHNNVDEMTCAMCFTFALKTCGICKRNLCLKCIIRNDFCAYCYENETALSVIEAIEKSDIEIKPKTFCSYIYHKLKCCFFYTFGHLKHRF